ncbi:hypothetical protein [Brucella sp. BO2]|uniref:hypothetical protein n=1 Tax=Brucella sp. BO2 TaxID=693750 RepID=UPI0012E9F621|nr:hypothetical protein [Brucella sp. BO2]
MAQRIYQSGNPPRLITSKPGYNASPSLNNANKTFDSDWFNGCAIKWRLMCNVPANTPTGAYVKMFPYALNYIPMVYIFGVQVYSDNPITDYVHPTIKQLWDVAPYGPSMFLGVVSTTPIWQFYNDRAVFIGTPPYEDLTSQLIIFEA